MTDVIFTQIYYLSSIKNNVTHRHTMRSSGVATETALNCKIEIHVNYSNDQKNFHLKELPLSAHKMILSEMILNNSASNK